MELDDDDPILIVYRTNGIMWAAFAQYRDGTEEPSDIFGNAREMLRDADRRFRVKIEFRPQELGCESGDEELAAIRQIVALFDASTE